MRLYPQAMGYPALLLLLFVTQGLPEGVRTVDAASAVRVLDAPRLLAGDIELQWGGQNFSYLLEGERGLFWTALRYAGEDRLGRPIVGQVPRGLGKTPSAGALAVRTAELPIAGEDLHRIVQPQLVRTPDGILHAFVGYYEGGPSCGHMAVFRTAQPEDVGTFVRVGELPLGRFAGFQIRENVALSRDGKRLVVAIMSCFAEGRHLINTPLILFGEREGLGFRFAEPIAFEVPTPFFYPLVAATDAGVVMLGSVHDEGDTRRDALLMHVDWQGRLLHRELLPAPPDPGNYYAHALAPLDPEDWTRLAIMRACVPDEGTLRTAEFWTYDARSRELLLARSVPCDFSVTRAVSNAGDFLPRAQGPPLFLNNPASRELCVWEGDLFGQGPVRIGPLSGTQPFELGYAGSRSVYVPNVLQGSLVGRELHVGADVTNAGKPKPHRGPCSFLAWPIAVD